MVTFSRIDAETWGIRSEQPLTAGDRVVAVRKDGSEVPVTVGRVLWTRNGVSLAEIDRSAAGGRGGGGRAASTGGGGRRKAAKPTAPPPPVPASGDDDIVF